MSDTSKILRGKDLYDNVREVAGPVQLLSFSTGKDSIGAYLGIRDHFEVVPYYLYLIPGLEFVEDSLAYYETVFGRHIVRMPHPSLYRWLNNLTHQTPGNAAVITAAGLEEFTYLDIHNWVCGQEGIKTPALTATGVRAADSPMRRVAITTHGPLSLTKKLFHAVWDWDKERLLTEIERAGIKLPADYTLFGRTFDGLDLRFLYPLRKHFPRDYARVCEFFPLIEMEIWRYERFGKAPDQGH